MTLPVCKTVTKSLNASEIWQETHLSVSCVSVPADVLAPFGARISAGTVMTKVGSHINAGPAVNSLRLSDAYMHQLTNHHWLRQQLVTWQVPSHYLKFWTNAGILLIGPFGTNFSEIFIKIHTFSFKKMLLNMSGSHLLSAPICWWLRLKRKIFRGL